MLTNGLIFQNRCQLRYPDQAQLQEGSRQLPEEPLTRLLPLRGARQPPGGAAAAADQQQLWKRRGAARQPLQHPGTEFTNISTIFLSFFYLFSKLLLNCF
jgi:hypothetical protein